MGVKIIVTILSSNPVDYKCYHAFTSREESSVDFGRYFQAHMKTRNCVDLGMYFQAHMELGKLCGSWQIFKSTHGN